MTKELFQTIVSDSVRFAAKRSMHALYDITNLFRARRYRFALPLLFSTLVLPLCLVGSCNTQSVQLGAGQAFAAAYTPQTIADLPMRKQAAYAKHLVSMVKSEPESLMGLHKAEVLLSFAKPDLVRTDGDSSSWHYRTDTCVLDVYFQRDVREDAAPEQSVVYYNVRARHTAHLIRQGEDEAKTGAIALSQQESCLRMMLKGKDLDQQLFEDHLYMSSL